MTVRNVLRTDHERGAKCVSARSSQAASPRAPRAHVDPGDSATHRFDPSTQSLGGSELLAAMAGVLRLPLSHIKGSVTSLRQTDVRWDGETRLDSLAEIDAETDRLSQIVDSLLPDCAADADKLFTSPCGALSAKTIWSFPSTTTGRASLSGTASAFSNPSFGVR